MIEAAERFKPGNKICWDSWGPEHFFVLKDISNIIGDYEFKGEDSCTQHRHGWHCDNDHPFFSWHHYKEPIRNGKEK